MFSMDSNSTISDGVLFSWNIEIRIFDGHSIMKKDKDNLVVNNPKGIEIGNHVIISPKCGVGHDSIIKDYVSLLWNVNVSGNDLIEEGVMMGSGSTVIQGKRIEKGSTVGAGAVVIDDIDSYSTVVGVPAKVIKVDYGRRERENEESLICNNCK